MPAAIDVAPDWLLVLDGAAPDAVALPLLPALPALPEAAPPVPAACVGLLRPETPGVLSGLGGADAKALMPDRPPASWPGVPEVFPEACWKLAKVLPVVGALMALSGS
jgi:hypothetical protein